MILFKYFISKLNKFEYSLKLWIFLKALFFFIKKNDHNLAMGADTLLLLLYSLSLVTNLVVGSSSS